MSDEANTWCKNCQTGLMISEIQRGGGFFETRIEPCTVCHGSPCPVWDDGQHCYSDDRVLIRASSNSAEYRVMSKSCACGKTVERRRPPPGGNVSEGA